MTAYRITYTASSGRDPELLFTSLAYVDDNGANLVLILQRTSGVRTIPIAELSLIEEIPTAHD